MEAELLELLRQTVTIEPYTFQDQNSNPTYGAAVTYPCRIQNNVNFSFDKDGEQRNANGTVIYIDGNPPITVRDRLTIDGSTPSQPPILRVNAEVDENGAAYYTAVYF